MGKMVGWGIWVDHGGGDGWMGKMVGWGRWLDGEDGWIMGDG